MFAAFETSQSTSSTETATIHPTTTSRKFLDSQISTEDGPPLNYESPNLKHKTTRGSLSACQGNIPKQASFNTWELKGGGRDEN